MSQFISPPPPINTKIVAEYIWLDSNMNFRSKSRVLKLFISHKPRNQLLTTYHNAVLLQIPDWNYDGSSTGQAEGSDSEIMLKPVKLFYDPFRSGCDLLVWCETYLPDGSPTVSNKRPYANQIFEQHLNLEPWYGLEQEYFIINPDTNLPLGFDQENEPEPQGPYYCGIGTKYSFGRNLAEDHLRLCMRANINISGINAEVAPGQWEYQIGPCTGIDAGDQLWVSRYILERIAEDQGYLISFHPKPVAGDWNGSGCHTNFSTKEMREGVGNKKGLEFIYDAMKKLELRHDEHMLLYGEDNNLRMTGEHETSSYKDFSVGKASRCSSIRIGHETINKGKGYFEDRRPSSNMNPYLVTAILLETVTLSNKMLEKNEL